MHVEAKEIEYCKLQVMYEADVDSVKKKRQEAIKQLRKVALPGFRPGKAPDHLIKVKLKKQIDNFVAKEMSAQAYDDMVFETKIKPIGYPQFSNVRLENDVFSCEMTVMKKPDFTLAEYKGLETTKPQINRDVQARVDATIADLGMRYGDVVPYKEGDFVEMGDQISMDVSFGDLSEPGILYTIGENRWDGLDQNLLGMAPGEDREFDLSDKHVKVTVHMGTKRTPCAIDDELAKKVGLNSLEEAKQKLVTLAEHEIKASEARILQQQISALLVEKHNFEVPTWLASMEAQHLALQNGQDWKKLGDEIKNTFVEMATKNVKLSLIIDSVRDNEPEAVLANNEAIEMLKYQVKSRGMDADQFLVESQKNGRLHGLVSALKDEYALQWIIDQAKITENEK